MCLGFLLLSRVSTLPMFYGAFALIAIGTGACADNILMSAISNWFRRKARVAVSIVSSGWGISGLLIPGVTKLIDTLQWPMAMFIVGLGMLVTVLPMSLVIRHKPENYGYQLDGEVTGVIETDKVETLTFSRETNISTRQALKTRVLWVLAITAFCQSFAVGATVTHIMPYLSSLGIERSLSSFIALIIPIITIGGRLCSGWLSNIFGSKKILMFGLISIAIGLLIFSYITSTIIWLLAPAVITFSLGWGLAVTTRITSVRDYFGRNSFGSIFGFIMGVTMLGTVIGTPFAGWIFDVQGTYQYAWLGCSVLALIGGMTMLTIPSSTKTTK